MAAAAACLTRRKKVNLLSRISLADPNMDSPSRVESAPDSAHSGDVGHMEAAQSVG